MKDGSLLFRVHPGWAQGHFTHWAAAKQVSGVELWVVDVEEQGTCLLSLMVA